MEQKELNTRYDEYKGRMETRIAAGEKLTIQERKKWIRVVEIEDNENPGKMKKVSLPGVTGETANERGSRVAEVRMSKLLDAADRLEQATSSAYKYTPEQVDKIIAGITEMSENLIREFTKKKDEKQESPEEPKKKKFQF